MSKYLFLISHPAHFHMFKYSIQELKKHGHEVTVVIRPKDVLEQLCIESNLNYIKIKDRPKNGGLLKLAQSLFEKDIQIHKIVKKIKPDLLLGSDGSIARAGISFHIPSFEFSEDDAKAIKLYAFTSYTFFTGIISPTVVDAWLWNKKKISYNGYQKLAYLHPNKFYPDKKTKEKYIKEQKYFILRLSALNAYHDIGMKGFNENIIDKIINKLELYGKIYISSEKELPIKYNKYKLNINPLDIHHILAFSSMLIGDSQSMSVESALLGVPSIRYSSFAGKLSVLEELEHKYELTYGFLPEQSEAMFEKIEKLLSIPNLKEEWQQRRQSMLQDKIDVTAFFVWFIENYPESAKIMKENPDYQYNFK
ncbi:DUF354 domain-containing protein [Porphyromonadaceae sp. NP-X]|nr:DUF354 domain-containing protein [Porphyromonadaceae sp. NP-X]